MKDHECEYRPKVEKTNESTWVVVSRCRICNKIKNPHSFAPESSTEKTPIYKDGKRKYPWNVLQASSANSLQHLRIQQETKYPVRVPSI